MPTCIFIKLVGLSLDELYNMWAPLQYITLMVKSYGKQYIHTHFLRENLLSGTCMLNPVLCTGGPVLEGVKFTYWLS